MKMRCLLLPGLTPLLENSASKKQARFSVQTVEHTHAHTRLLIAQIARQISCGKIITKSTRESRDRDMKKATPKPLAQLGGRRPRGCMGSGQRGRKGQGLIPFPQTCSLGHLSRLR